MLKKTRVILPLFFCIISVVDSRAQDEAKPPHPETKSGSAAFLFTLSGLGAFGVNGYTFPATFDSSGLFSGNHTIVAGGGKWFVADELALRGLLGIRSTSSGSEDNADGKTTSTLFGFSGGIEMHSTLYAISMYFGGQVFYSQVAIKNTKNSGESEVQTNKAYGNAYGIGILAGFDWYFTYGIAIGGEFMYGYTTSSSQITTPQGTTIDNPAPSFFALTSGNIHLAVHF